MYKEWDVVCHLADLETLRKHLELLSPNFVGYIKDDIFAKGGHIEFVNLQETQSVRIYCAEAAYQSLPLAQTISMCLLSETDELQRLEE